MIEFDERAGVEEITGQKLSLAAVDSVAADFRRGATNLMDPTRITLSFTDR